MKPAPTWNGLTLRQKRKRAIKLQNTSAIKLSMSEAFKLAQVQYDKGVE